MKVAAAALVLLVLPLARARSISDVDLSDTKQYPVTKVITLLKDMEAQLSKEAEEDEDVYDKMACWCKTNDREKTKAIKDAQARLNDLATTIETSAAASARLNVEIKNHQRDLRKGKKSLDDLTAIRTKQAKEFNGEEKDMLQSISSLKSAIVVLSKHHTKASLVAARQLVKVQMDKHHMMLLGVITPRQKRVVLGAFVQEEEVESKPKFRRVEKPASGEIFGILRQMKETFENNLSQSQKEELANEKAFQEQRSAKNDELEAIGNSLNQKQAQLAKSDELNAQSKEDREDTKNSLDIDSKFLIGLKQRCKMTDSEWVIRQKARQDELLAISKAISILSDDAAHDNFSKTFNAGAAASFVQKKVIHRHTGARHQAATMLRALADKTGNPALAGLAMAAELDAFTKVKAAIDKMVRELANQKAMEIKEKSFCIDKINENTLLTEKETRKKSDSEMKIATLKVTINELKESVSGLTKEILEMNLQTKRAGEDRELENRDFQATIADQRETQVLLNKAITVLNAVYNKAPKRKGSFAVRGGRIEYAAQAPPAGFKDYSNNAGGGGAVALLTKILGDARVMEAEAKKDEQAAQVTYEKFVKASNNAIASKQTAIVNKNEDKAKAQQDMNRAKTDLEQQRTQLKSYRNEKNDLSLKCDFLLKNFQMRQEARDEEINALKQAKAILSGMQSD